MSLLRRIWLFGFTSENGAEVNNKGELLTSPNINKSAYGDSVYVEEYPFIQANGVYDFIPNNFRSFTSLGGATSASNGFFVTQTGTTSGGYSAVQSFRSLAYKSGKGAIAKFSAIFSNNVANSWSGVGLVNLSDELSFGFDGAAFGIWHRYGGYAQVVTITITTPSSGATNLTLTLNSVAYIIPLTAGTANFNANEIATWLNANQSVWVADQLAGTVIVSAQSDGPKTGAYSYSHATSTGTITTNTTGVTKISTHYPQASWLNNTMPDLDVTKLNLYKIVYDDDVKFYIIDADTGNFDLVHTIKWLNNNSTPLLTNPSLRFGMYGVSLGSTTNIIVRCSGVSLASQGIISRTRNPRSVKNTQIVTTTSTNILSLRNRKTFNGLYNQVELEPLLLSISSESNKNVEIDVLASPTFSGATNFLTIGTNLVGDLDTTSNTVSGGTPLASVTVGSTGTAQINLSALDVIIPPSLNITIAARVTSGPSSNVTASLIYYEDL